jgi:hypothetical protein
MEMPADFGDERPKHRAVILPVLGAGVTTTAIALFIVSVIDRATEGTSVMGFYGDFIPIGAIGVGFAAGSGYGLAAWWLNRRVSAGLYVAVGLLQIGAYFVAQYEDYRQAHPVYVDTNEPVSFTTYFDATTRSFTFTSQHDRTPGKPLGAWGYLLRCAEIAGFGLGGILVPLLLSRKAYCNSCSVYMRTKSLGWLPAGTNPKKIKKKDVEAAAAYEKANADTYDQAMATVAELGALSGAGRRAELDAAFIPHKPQFRAYQKLTCRMAVSLSTCPVCQRGKLTATAVRGQGKYIKRVNVAEFAYEPEVTQLGEAGERLA